MSEAHDLTIFCVHAVFYRPFHHKISPVRKAVSHELRKAVSHELLHKSNYCLNLRLLLAYNTFKVGFCRG